MNVSVVIPVLRDWDALERCLQSLRAQNLPQPGSEIIVVDNDRTALEPAKRPAGVHYVHCPRGYSYAARNAGLAQAKGDIIAFTDADCLPEPGWLQAGCQTLASDPSVDLVGGEVEVFPENRALASIYECLYSFRQQENVQKSGVSVTANLFVRRHVFQKIGFFRDDFESGGDYEFCKRATQAGFRLKYAGNALVRHPARATLRALLRRRARVARGHCQAHFVAQRLTFGRALWKALALFRPNLKDWMAALNGPGVRQALASHRRPAFAALRVFLQYHYAAWVLYSVIKTGPKRLHGPG